MSLFGENSISISVRWNKIKESDCFYERKGTPAERDNIKLSGHIWLKKTM